MVTDVTVASYVDFLNAALADGTARIGEHAVLAAYSGDTYVGVKHEVRIDPGDYRLVPLDDPASRFTFDGQAFAVKIGWETHPMSNVTWFGARAYCRYYGWRLPTEMEWEKAARGTDGRAYPWGSELTRNHANFYNSRDPYEEMSSFGSRTTPVGFYQGKTYDRHVTHDAASPYGLYDMAGNVWQWIGDTPSGPGASDRFMRGGSKDSYAKDLRVWVRNSAPPMYYGPGVGFRCTRQE
jgi:formylglycine-generating enzyme required for sulfatase activity